MQWKKTIVPAVYQQIKFRVRDLHAAGACYYLDCWLGVTIKDIAAAWLTLKNTGLLIRCNRNYRYFYSGLVWCKGNRKRRWWDIAITNINAGLVQLHQTCMLVCASLTDMIAG